MDGLLVPIIVAGTVITFVWGLVSVVNAGQRGDKRKLAERLSGEGRTSESAIAASVSGQGKSIVVELEVKGVPASLAKRPFIQKLNRRVLQAYPERTLG